MLKSRAALAAAVLCAAPAETWRRLVVAPDRRCAPYDKRGQYPCRPSSRTAWGRNPRTSSVVAS